MMKLYYAPRTRSVRVRCLLEEIGLPYELERIEFRPSAQAFTQATPLGKLPVLVDGETVIGESGAILEYILERHGNGRMAPPSGSPLRGEFLQWMHFAEGTAYPPLGVIIWHTIYLQNADQVALAVDSARERAHAALGVLERRLAGRDFLLGAEFSAADIMVAFTLAAAQFVGVLDDRYARLPAYLAAVMGRPSFQRATAD